MRNTFWMHNNQNLKLIWVYKFKSIYSQKKITFLSICIFNRNIKVTAAFMEALKAIFIKLTKNNHPQNSKIVSSSLQPMSN